MKFENQDVVSMVDGSSYVGVVTTRQFTIRVYKTNTLVVDRDDLVHIVTRLSHTGGDEFLLADSSMLRGELINLDFNLTLTNGTNLTLPFDQTLSIQFLSNIHS